MALQNAFALELRTDPTHAGRKKRDICSIIEIWTPSLRFLFCKQVNIAKK